MLKELLEKEREILNHFFDQINLSTAEKLFEILKECKGLIIVTGVGKSGLIAEKIAQTMTSTGSRAFFLSPTNAMHGDIGIVSKDDVFLMISKSGESEELLQMVPFLRNRGVMPIAIVNNANSRLAKACEFSVILPMEKELCPFDLVPTTSAVIQLIFGDVLAVALMSHKNFSLLEYAMNHPAGKIGRRLTLRVRDLMLKGDDVPLCKPADKLVDTLVELSNKRCGCVMIVDAQTKLLGIFTDGDLRRALQKLGSKILEATMLEVMTKTARFIQSAEMASQALTLMEADQQHPITVLPVIDEDQKVVGLIKMHDIVQSGL
ncbi:MAG TPA: KpsF/GutQ family sugar-phosphate isomerase [Parachlamydiaceae bacterium]|nr:KpsF/GutQ family sugar-phosphate isomerase [Parachlamydiaceae bacterium]